MEKNEFASIMAGIHAGYPNEKITEDEKTVGIWWAMLKDLEYRQVSKNLEKHIKNNKFMPTIAELRDSSEGNRFNNFLPRGYDMTKLEVALLEADRPKKILEVRGDTYGR